MSTYQAVLVAVYVYVLGGLLTGLSLLVTVVAARTGRLKDPETRQRALRLDDMAEVAPGGWALLLALCVLFWVPMFFLHDD